MDYYESYAEYQRDLDDRDDTYDPEFRDPEGYCEHGTYVGGCGADLMCSWCEDGISVREAKRIITMERTRAVRDRAERTAQFLAAILAHGVPGMDAAKWAEDSSHVGNPLSRYGRH